MPLVRKLFDIGGSRAVVLPADWLKYYEDKIGRKIEEVLIEVNGSLTIRVEESKENHKSGD